MKFETYQANPGAVKQNPKSRDTRDSNVIYREIMELEKQVSESLKRSRATKDVAKIATEIRKRQNLNGELTTLYWELNDSHKKNPSYTDDPVYLVINEKTDKVEGRYKRKSTADAKCETLGKKGGRYSVLGIGGGFDRKENPKSSSTRASNIIYREIMALEKQVTESLRRTRATKDIAKIANEIRKRQNLHNELTTLYWELNDSHKK